ncbi:MAG: hypothetical protein R6V05_12595 [Candidatus Brocadiia bacterium]
MASGSQKSMSRKKRLEARLEIIRRRHQELILQPREVIGADLDGDLTGPLGEFDEPDEVRILEASQAGQL